jgi:hypothetical protein
VFDTAAVNADLATGGVRINFIAREGGNQYHGSVFGNFANDSFQTTNVDADLLRRNPALANAGTVDKNWDFNPGFGGPLKRDKVWFYLSGRSQGAWLFAPGVYYNKNANDPTKWTYDPDLSQPASIQKNWLDAQGRFTWQVSQKNKLGLTYTQQDFCACHDNIGPQGANIHTPEAAYDRRFPTQRVVLLDWTSPVTNKVLIEASGIHRVERWGNMNLQERGLAVDPAMIGVIDTAANVPGLGVIPNLAYRGRAVPSGPGNSYNNSWNENFHWRFHVSYITGSHAMKFGSNDAIGRHSNQTYLLNNLQYRFTNGVPNLLTMRALPNTQRVNVDHDLGLFAQDKWTMERLTVSYGIRYDHFINSFPEQTLGPTTFTPGRNLTFASTKNANLQDITPRTQVAYDLFGTGKTAVKASFNKYLQGLGTTGFITGNPNPIALLADNASRAWNDANRNFVPDCDLSNLQANGECGLASNLAFGSPTPNTRFDPELLTGWGNRFYNWEFSASVQHEIVPRVSVDVGYFRRWWYGNLAINDNLAVTPADFDTISVTAPADSRLPNGGSYTVGGLKVVKDARFGQSDNLTTRADTYGKAIDHWNGLDVTVNTRLQNGITAQFGTSTGRTSRDFCDVLDDVPEAAFAATAAGNWALTNIAPPGLNQGLLPYCKYNSIWQTQMKGFAAYTVPRIDVQVSGTYQYLPGPEVAANWNAPNAAIQPSLGRPLPGAQPFMTVNLIEPGQEFTAGLNQLDLRFAKLLRFGGTRTIVSFDLYNATNSNTILTLNNNFVVGATGNTWLVPTSILQPRFFKIGAQFDF